MKLHAGDMVVVITGKDKGKTGRILRILTAENRVVVTGANMRTRHIKKTPQNPGRKIQYEASIHASNVMFLDPKTKKPTRVGYRFTGDKKERFAKVSGDVIVSGRKLRKLVEEEMVKEELKTEKKTSLRQDSGRQEGGEENITSAPAAS